jgi:hypothetical protein
MSAHRRHDDIPACRECGADVRIVKRQGNRGWLVLDFAPTPMGDVAIDDNNEALVLGPGDILRDKDNTERFARHWHSCPARAAA